MNINKNEIHAVERLRSLYQSFSSAFLTLISIVQGAVLSYFALIVGENLHDFNVARWMLAGATFLVIVVI